MKLVPVLRRASVAAFLLSTAFLQMVATSAAPQHGFKVKEYEQFHNVLHPLEHEALPRKDFKRIRAESSLLIKRGRAIVKVSVPRGTSEEKQEEFRKELKSFDKALTKFRAAARTEPMPSLRPLTAPFTTHSRCWLP